jgi:2-keto-3-deoxy-L-rhamnonate aldolase RhmA
LRHRVKEICCRGCYLDRADCEICLLLQIETKVGLENVFAIVKNY